MRIIDCLDREVSDGKVICLPGRYLTVVTSLEAQTIEERELLISIAKLLYKVKSVRKVIEIIDKQVNSP